MANQYGIDVGNVLSKASDIKSARLNVLANEDALEQRKLDRNERRETAKRTTANTQKMASSDPRMEGYDVQTPKELQQVQTFLNNADNNQKQEALAIVETLGKYSMAILNSKDPQQKEAMWEELKTKIPPESKGDMPDTYSEKWLVMKATEAKTITDMIKQDVAKTKTIAKREELGQRFKNELDLESQKQKNRTSLETQKQKNKIAFQKTKVPEASKKEFMQIMNLLEGGDLTEMQERFYKARLTKLSQPDMKSKEVDINTANRLRGEFATKVGLDNPYSLSTIDTRTLTPEQQAEANTVGQNLVKLSGANAKVVDKKMANYGSMLEQTQNALSAYENVGDFRLVDEATKKYISNYTGLSRKEIESTEAAQALQSLLNISTKADSGTAVSAHEMVRKTLETATASMDKRRIILGIKNLAKRNIGELKGLEKVMGQVPFNLRYGGVMRNYKDILDNATNTTSPKSKTLEELRANKSSNTSVDDLVNKYAE